MTTKKAKAAPKDAPTDPTNSGETADPLAVEVDGLLYRLDKPPTKSGKKIVTRVPLASGGGGRKTAPAASATVPTSTARNA